MTQKELLAVSNITQVQKPTDHMAPPVFPIRPTDGQNKKTCAIQPEDNWWIGPVKPIMSWLGETKIPCMLSNLKLKKGMLGRILHLRNLPKRTKTLQLPTKHTVKHAGLMLMPV
jgi:hypothetical protein